jgi:hypothetical protein
MVVNLPLCQLLADEYMPDRPTIDMSTLNDQQVTLEARYDGQGGASIGASLAV